MLTLSDAAILEKNKLAATGAWLVLCEIALLDGANTIRLARNNEDVTWGGQTWTAFGFEVDDIGDRPAGESPQIRMRVANATRAMQAYLELYEAYVIGAPVTFYVVHANHLDLAAAELQIQASILEATCTAQWVSLSLGPQSYLRKRFPGNRMTKNHCRYKVFKGDQCRYAGTASTCDRTLRTCRAYGNSRHFGGFPSVGQGGVYV